MINRKLQYIPKMGMCAVCESKDEDCSSMPFKAMPHIGKGDSDGIVIVRCAWFERRKPEECNLNLKPCPCGETPTELHLDTGNCSKYAYASGDCCNGWSVEFRTNYHTIAAPECMEIAVDCWNETKRNGE